MFLYKHSKETKENKLKLEKLISMIGSNLSKHFEAINFILLQRQLVETHI